jgi:hypothetical protein
MASTGDDQSASFDLDGVQRSVNWAHKTASFRSISDFDDIDVNLNSSRRELQIYLSTTMTDQRQLSLCSISPCSLGSITHVSTGEDGQEAAGKLWNNALPKSVNLLLTIAAGISDA